MGICTAAFSIIDALILRPLPIPQPQQIVHLAYPAEPRRGPIPGPGEEDSFSYPLYQRLRQEAASEIELFGVTYSPGFQRAVFIDGAGEAESVRAESMSGNAFAVLGVSPAAGRLFTADDDGASGGQAVAVLSYAFWWRRFGGNPSVLGRRMTLAGRQFQIAGVAGKRFSGLEPGYLTDLWIPLAAGAGAQALSASDARWVKVWGRLSGGVPAERARLTMQAAFTGYRRERAGAAFPHDAPPRQVAAFLNAGLILRPAATGRGSLFRSQFKRPLWILGLISALILLAACSNVANLLIARGAARAREMALRLSLGARRSRLVRQLLAESALVAGAAGILGAVLAAYATPFVVRQLGTSDFPAYLDVSINGRLLAFLVLCGALTALLFGAIPALRASAVSPHAALQAESARGAVRMGTSRAVLSAQVAFSVAVLFLCGLLLRSFQNLIHIDLGFAKERVLLLTVDAGGLDDREQRTAAVELLDAIRRMPGVEGAAASQYGLMGGAFAPMIAPLLRCTRRSRAPRAPLSRFGPSRVRWAWPARCANRSKPRTGRSV